MERLEVECAVLADMIYSDPHPAQSTLLPDDFASPLTRAVFEVLTQLRQAGHHAPGIMPLYSRLLESHQDAKDAPWEVFVGELAMAYTVPENIKPKVAMLKRYSTRSELRSLGGTLVQSNESTEDLLAKTREVAARPRDLMERDDLDTLEEIVTNLEAETKIGPDPRALTTGFPDLDRYGLLTRGSLTVVAARTSVGKTAFACSLAAYWLPTNRGVVYCAAEESPAEIIARIGRMMPSGVGLLKYSPLLVRSCRRLSHVALAIKEAAFEPEIVIVDHLHELHTETPRDSQVQELGDLMQSLRDIAKESNLPVIVLAQLSRQTAHRENQKPHLEDLRGSGNIEEKADKVWLLWRDIADAELVIAKNRQGHRDKIVPMTFLLDKAQFVSRSHV